MKYDFLLIEKFISEKLLKIVGFMKIMENDEVIGMGFLVLIVLIKLKLVKNNFLDV